MCECNNHIGYSPASARTVTPVPPALLGLVPKPVDNVLTVKPSTPDVERDTMPLIISKTNRTAWQVKKLAPKLKGDTLEKTLRNVSDFVLKHIKYEKDHPDHEQVRSPRRTIHEGKGDCDCMSVLVGALLKNLGIDFKFRIAKYPNSPGSWSHIYVVVPKDQSANKALNTRAQYYTVDPVTNRHDHEVKFLNKKDYDMALQSLDGFGDCSKQQTAESATVKRNKRNDYVPVKTLLKRGYALTKDVLAKNRTPHRQTANGTFVISTPAGEREIPALLNPTQVKILSQPIAQKQLSGDAQKPSQEQGSNGAVWLAVVALGTLALGMWGTEKPSTLEGHKRKIPVLQL